jgi:hypothetical protein
MPSRGSASAADLYGALVIDVIFIALDMTSRVSASAIDLICGELAFFWASAADLDLHRA